MSAAAPHNLQFLLVGWECPIYFYPSIKKKTLTLNLLKTHYTLSRVEIIPPSYHLVPQQLPVVTPRLHKLSALQLY